MGGRDDRAKVTFRATEEQVDQLDAWVKASGLTKQEYLLNAVFAQKKDTLHTLVEAAPKAVVAKVKADSSNDISILKGMKASVAILQGQELTLKCGKKVLYHDGAIWLVGKTSNGSQDELGRLVEYPSQLWQVLAECVDRYNHHYSFDEVKAAIVRWNELTQLEGFSQVVGEVEYRFSALFNADVFETFKLLVMEKIQKLEPLEEPTAEVEVSTDEMVINDVEQPLTPQNEELDKYEFCKMMGWAVKGQEYCKAASAGECKDSQGNTWKRSGSKKGTMWTMQAVRQLELAV